jgi:hypothetical protein
METLNSKIEHEPASKDISDEFKNLPWHEFRNFLRTLRKEPSLSITIDWVDVPTARRLKAFLEDFSTLGNQKRSATIRATQEQHDQEMNVFASGVKWEKV